MDPFDNALVQLGSVPAVLVAALAFVVIPELVELEAADLRMSDTLIFRKDRAWRRSNPALTTSHMLLRTQCKRCGARVWVGISHAVRRKRSPFTPVLAMGSIASASPPASPAPAGAANPED